MTRRRTVVALAACVLAVGAFAAAREPGAVRITKDPQGYWFTEGDTKVLDRTRTASLRRSSAIQTSRH